MIRKISFAVFLAAGTVAYAKGVAPEESVKAGFILQFMNFIKWDDAGQEYFICIPNDDGLRKAVRESLEGAKIDDRKITVVERSDFCHIMVADPAPSSERTLTIGELNQGALLEFRVVNNKLKFAINAELVKHSKLKISSQLLKLAILENSQ